MKKPLTLTLIIAIKKANNMPVVTKVSYVENKGRDIELQKTR